MIEIKFRMWDDVNKKISFPFTIIDISEGNFKASAPFGEYNNFDLKTCTVMQYTGLKDKNSKEIYGGYICRWLGFEVRAGKQIRPERIFEVTGDIVNLFQLKNIIEGNSAGTLEIIGNIYENPELLKSK